MANVNVARSEKREAVECWVEKHMGNVAHERRVLRIAGELLELTAELHALSGAERHLLELGVLAHDVGRSVDDDRHPAIGAEMILEDEELPLSSAERRALAYLTRFHRGSVPELEEDGILQAGDNHESLRRVLGFLRAADGLDSRWLGSPRLLMSLHRRTIQIHCYVEKDTPKIRRMFTRKKKFRLLEETLGCEVNVELALSDGLRLVA